MVEQDFGALQISHADLDATHAFGDLLILALFIVGGIALAGVGGLIASLRPRTPRPPQGPSGGAVALGELIEVFQPSRTHTREDLEYKRLEITQAPGTDLGVSVDLERGQALINLPVDQRPGTTSLSNR
ncbi:hypothetical protein [Isoptericola sp. NPDC057191]|uniref:hypothetical protein n=1 Tax=Isoptericola sp. NPDC057191 TaxID=3346041 RepID=UPI003632F108